MLTLEQESALVVAIVDVIGSPPGTSTVRELIGLEAARQLPAVNAYRSAEWIVRWAMTQPSAEQLLRLIRVCDTGALIELDDLVGGLTSGRLPGAAATDRGRAALERRRLIDPLRALAGKHFHGRDHEIDVIRRHLNDTGGPPVLVLEGPGGTGKSSLIGRVLLDLEQDPGAPPFAYLDFDKAEHDPLRPSVLIDRIARQLRLRYATSFESSLHYAEIQGAADSGTAVVDLVAQLFAELTEPLVLVLDTFEEVQIQGPGAVRSVLQLIGTLLDRMPGTRLVIAGRAAGTEFPDSPLLRIGDLSPGAGDEVLRHLGVTDPAVRELILSRFGANPLTLKLSAEALLQNDSGGSALESLSRQSAALARISAEQIQGLLYARILGHLSSPEVARVAHPGLAVRRITVDVLRDVLAVPCDLDPENAERLFELLRREVSMFETEEDGTLRHRTDVRRLMLRTMLDDPSRARQVTDIHHRAIAFYRDRPGSKARAEELYHRLMAGEDMRSQRPDWNDTLRVRLMPALDEPLPETSMSWLRRHLGLSAPGQDPAWEQTEWEALTETRVRSLLDAGDSEGALLLLGQRLKRLPDSRLYPLEVGAWLLGRDYETAARVLEHGIAAAVDAGSAAAELRLAEMGVELGVRSGDTRRTTESARAAVAWCDQTAQPKRAVRVLCRAATTTPDTRTDLGRRFAALTRRDVRSDPGVVRAVLHIVGADQPDVLWHAAEHCGEGTGRGGVFLPDSLALTRLLAVLPETAEPALQPLADEVGLPPGHWQVTDLARGVIKHDRLGRAVQALLAADDTVAPRIVTELVREPDQLTLLT